MRLLKLSITAPDYVAEKILNLLVDNDLFLKSDVTVSEEGSE